MSNETGKLKTLCPYCNAAWDAKMEADIEVSMSCPTCGPETSDLCIEIFCSNCNKLVYKKEGSYYDF